MAWTSPRTWTPRTKVTAAILNTELAGNLNALAAGPYCNVWASAATTMTSAAPTTYAIAFDTEIADTDTMHDTSTNTSRITAKTAGLYQFNAGFGIVAQAAATRIVGMFMVNGSAVLQTYHSLYVPANTPAAVDGHYGMHLSMMIRLSVNDYVQLGAQCGTAGVSTAIGSTGRAFMQARWLGP